MTILKNNLIAGTYQPSMYNGRIYTLSAYTDVFGLEQNCKVVEEAGFNCNKPPQTWDELLQQPQAITQKGNKQYYGYIFQGPAGFSMGAVLRLAIYLAQANVPLCKNYCTELWFNYPQAVPVYRFIRNLNKTTPPGLAFNSDEASVYSQLFKKSQHTIVTPRSVTTICRGVRNSHKEWISERVKRAS